MRSLVVAAVRVPLAAPPCLGCAGGGDVNGVPCRSCEGSGRTQGRARRDWRSLLHSRPVLAAATAAGTVVGWSRTLPGVGGAAAVSAGLGGVAGHVFGHGLTPWVAATVAGVFGLLMDRQIP